MIVKDSFYLEANFEVTPLEASNKVQHNFQNIFLVLHIIASQNISINYRLSSVVQVHLLVQIPFSIPPGGFLDRTKYGELIGDAMISS